MENFQEYLKRYVPQNSVLKVGLWILLFFIGLVGSIIFIKGATTQNLHLGINWLKFFAIMIIFVIVITFIFGFISYLKYLNPAPNEKLLTPETIENDTERFIYETVQEISQKVGLTKPPAIKISYCDEPNAFAMSFTRSHSIVTIHTGIIDLLDREALKAVIAHELGHIYNRDSIVSTFLYYFFKTLWGIFIVIPYLFIFISVVTSRENKHKAFWIFVINTIFFVITKLFFFFSTLIMNFHSRLREFRADRFASFVTSPTSMISALESLKNYALQLSYSSKFDTLKFLMPVKFIDYFSTHPNLDRRIRAIQEFTSTGAIRTSEEKREYRFGIAIILILMFFLIYVITSSKGQAVENRVQTSHYHTTVNTTTSSPQTNSITGQSQLNPGTQTFYSFLYHCDADDNFYTFYRYLYDNRKDLAELDRENFLLKYRIKGELYGLPVVAVWMGICDTENYLDEYANACGWATYLVLVIPKPLETVRAHLLQRTGIDFTEELRSPDVEATMRAYLKSIGENETGVVCDPGSL